MADEVTVTLVFFIPKDSGGFETQEYTGVVINTRATVRRVVQEILNAFPKLNLTVDDVDLLVQAPDGSTFSNLNLQEGSRILIVPKVVGPAVRGLPRSK